MTADGELKICSRTENQNLFRHALGGYGMMGILLEVWIRPVKNEIFALRIGSPPLRILSHWENMKKEHSSGFWSTFGRS